MKGSRENRSSRPVGSRAGHTTPKADPTARESGGARDALISTRCPNPACGKTYTIPSSYAGKNGRCKCGSVFPIPNTSAALSGDLYGMAKPSAANFICKSIDELHTASADTALAAFSLMKRL